MNEIANRPATEPAVTPATIPVTESVVQLQEWAAELSAARQLAQVLASSSFLPLALRQKSKNEFKTQEELVYDAAAVILAGKSVGLDPMQSVQNIFPVHGMPSMYARTMVALVIAQGHEVKRSSATDSAVTYSVRRKGTDDWQEFTWTIERAKKAGYTSNGKYVSDPIAMLGAKAAAEACRTVFPDILLGMAYSAEEIELEDMGETPKPVSAASRLAATVKAAAPVEADPEPEAAPATEPLCSRAQQGKLSSALEAEGHTTKAEKLAVVTSWAGRDVASAAELTVTEASDLTRELEDAAAARPAATEPGTDADTAWLAGASG